MANKKGAGTLIARKNWLEKALVNSIDKRERTGENRENVDSSYNEYTHADNGERVWSY